MIGLEQLADGSISDRNFQRLMSLVLDTGEQSLGLRVGTASVTFTASATSNTVGVTHGLGKTPEVVFVGAATANNLRAVASSLSATGFNVTGYSGIGSITGPMTVYWAVIG